MNDRKQVNIVIGTLGVLGLFILVGNSMNPSTKASLQISNASFMNGSAPNGLHQNGFISNGGYGNGNFMNGSYGNNWDNGYDWNDGGDGGYGYDDWGSDSSWSGGDFGGDFDDSYLDSDPRMIPSSHSQHGAASDQGSVDNTEGHTMSSRGSSQSAESEVPPPPQRADRHNLVETTLSGDRFPTDASQHSSESFQDNGNLSDIDLSTLQSSSAITIENNSNLSTIDLSDLDTVGGDIEIVNNGSLSNIDLSGMSSSAGDIFVDNNAGLSQIDLGDIGTIGGNEPVITDNNTLSTIDLHNLMDLRGPFVPNLHSAPHHSGEWNDQPHGFMVSPPAQHPVDLYEVESAVDVHAENFLKMIERPTEPMRFMDDMVAQDDIVIDGQSYNVHESEDGTYTIHDYQTGEDYITNTDREILIEGTRYTVDIDHDGVVNMEDVDRMNDIIEYQNDIRPGGGIISTIGDEPIITIGGSDSSIRPSDAERIDYNGDDIFIDVPQRHPYKEGIKYMSDTGMASGYSDGSFKPEKSVNRAEFAKMIAGSEAVHAAAGSSSFWDVDSSAWFAGPVEVVRSRGLMKGYADGSFGPGKEISFVEAATVIARKNNLAVDQVSQGDPWYKPVVDLFVAYDAIPETIGSLEQNVNRGEVAEMLHRIESQSQPVVEQWSSMSSVSSEQEEVHAAASSDPMKMGLNWEWVIIGVGRSTKSCAAAKTDAIDDAINDDNSVSSVVGNIAGCREGLTKENGDIVAEPGKSYSYPEMKADTATKWSAGSSCKGTKTSDGCCLEDGEYHTLGTWHSFQCYHGTSGDHTF